MCLSGRADANGRRVARCVPSECTSDADCLVGHECHIFGRVNGSIGQCKPTGLRKLGESCVPASLSEFSTCGPGLGCRAGRCLPKTCETSDDCGSGAICGGLAGAGREQRTCIASCEADSDCAAGEHCVDIHTHSICAQVPASMCPRQPCADGEFCHIDSSLAWDFRAQCVLQCDPDADASGCPDGQFCAPAMGRNRGLYPGRCYEPCETIEGCAEGYECKQAMLGIPKICHYYSRIPLE